MNSAQDDITVTSSRTSSEEPRVVIEHTSVNPEKLLSAQYEVRVFLLFVVCFVFLLAH